MGAAMMHDIVSLTECPESVRERALGSGQQHLQKLVTRLRLLQALSGGVTQPLFEQVLVAEDAVVQRALVERFELSRPQLERLAAEGVTRAVRNLAAVRMRRRQ